MDGENLIVLKSTGGIGDLVIASALVPQLAEEGYETGIISKGFILSLWHGLEHARTFASEEQVPQGAQVFDISDYLVNLPNSNTLFDEEEGGPRSHLCQWMAYSLLQKSGKFPRIAKVSRDNVRIALTPEEISSGQKKINTISIKHKDLPVFVMAPYSWDAKNKNLPESTLERVVEGISGFAVPCIMEQEQSVKGTYPIWDYNLRNSAALLACADACLCVDSGPLHLANGALQGIYGNTGENRRVVVALGSSHSYVVGYENNRIVLSNHTTCDVSPCGAHGYCEKDAFKKAFGKDFYPTTRDKSACAFSDYNAEETSRCMAAIAPEELIEKARTVLKS